MDDLDVIRAGPELVNAKTGKWLTPADVEAPVVILLHGFTSHGRYLQRMADLLIGHSFTVGILNYDSYVGIDKAAEALAACLEPIERPLIAQRWAIVAHSMGGLVARYFVQRRQSNVHRGLCWLALLGTPNRGTLSAEVVDYMLDWAEWLTLPYPYPRDTAGRSAKQLTGNDDTQLVRLLNLGSSSDLTLPVLSVSGGLAFLEVGEAKRSLRSRLTSEALQKLIADKPNDGLVPESSSNLERVVPPKSSNRFEHMVDYYNYTSTNHTYLTTNYVIANRIAQWLQERCFKPSEESA